MNDLENILAKVRSSAAGPDGIDYAAWKLAFPLIKKTLHEPISDACDSGQIFPEVECTITTLIPKTEGFEGNLLPPDTLPIALANTDFQILMRMVNLRLAAFAGAVRGPAQADFIRGGWEFITLSSSTLVPVP